MRFVKIILICLILCGCSSIQNNKSLDDIFADKSASSAKVNNYSDYINYYCPGDLHEISAQKTSIVFGIDDCKIILNVNMAGIINSQYYQEYSLADDGFFDKDKLAYSIESSYYDKNNNEVKFFFNLYDYDEEYLMHLANGFVNIYAYCDKENVNLIAGKTYDLLKSSSVNTSAVLANYSSRDVIEYHKSTVNLFETVMPVQGRIDDMMIDNQNEVSEN